MNTETASGGRQQVQNRRWKAVVPWDAQRSSWAIAELGADGCREGFSALPWA